VVEYAGTKTEVPFAISAKRTIAQFPIRLYDCRRAPNDPQLKETSLPEQASAGIEESIQPQLRHAGFWIRFAAAIVDFLILAIPFAVFVSFLSVGMKISNDFLALRPGMPPSEVLTRFGPTFLFANLCFFAITSWMYFAILESSSWRATVGKRLFGLYLAGADGNPIGFWRATRRFLGGRFLIHVPLVGIYYFLIDCLCVGIVPGKRAIHDMLSGSLVLRESLDKPPLP
jgi:uncharacterized RDD family membrane protein YckC